MTATIAQCISNLAKLKHAIETNVMMYVRKFAETYNMGEKNLPKTAGRLIMSYCDFLSKSFDDLTNDLEKLGVAEEHYRNVLVDIKSIRESSDHIRKILDLEEKYSLLLADSTKLLSYLETIEA